MGNDLRKAYSCTFWAFSLFRPSQSKPEQNVFSPKLVLRKAWRYELPLYYIRTSFAICSSFFVSAKWKECILTVSFGSHPFKERRRRVSHSNHSTRKSNSYGEDIVQ